MALKIIAIGSDHAGIFLKEKITKALELHGHKILDVGTYSGDSVDYPDFGYKVSEKVAEKQANCGIVICGSGIGISIAANRNPKIRAALCNNVELAKLSRQHNDANILALGARFIDEETAINCANTFLETEFEGGRHQARIDKLSNAKIKN